METLNRFTEVPLPPPEAMPDITPEGFGPRHRIDVTVEMINYHLILRAGCQAVVAHDIEELKTLISNVVDNMFRGWFAKKT